MTGSFERVVAPLQRGQLGFQIHKPATQCGIFVRQFGIGQLFEVRLREIGQTGVTLQRHGRISFTGDILFSR